MPTRIPAPPPVDAEEVISNFIANIKAAQEDGEFVSIYSNAEKKFDVMGLENKEKGKEVMEKIVNQEDGKIHLIVKIFEPKQSLDF